jgi:hypothetical protein
MAESNAELEALKSRIKVLGTVRNAVFGGALVVLGLQIFGHVGGLSQVFWVLLAGSFGLRVVRQSMVSKYLALVQQARSASLQ